MLVGLLSIIPIMNNLLEQRFFRLLSDVIIYNYNLLHK